MERYRINELIDTGLTNDGINRQAAQAKRRLTDAGSTKKGVNRNGEREKGGMVNRLNEHNLQ